MGKTRIPVLKTYKLYIGGDFPRTESGRYYSVNDKNGNPLANICLASRKDFRNAVVAARKALPGWSGRTAYNRGQILYRIAEMMEGRADQLAGELASAGSTASQARKEVEASIDRIVYYAGWTDKYQQIFGSVNPVATPHFNFSVSEPTGVVVGLAPEKAPLISLVTMTAALIAGGNTCILLASESRPVTAVTFAEIADTSDVPGGVINILTGKRDELLPHMADHMDVNAIWSTGTDYSHRRLIQEKAAENLKRISFTDYQNWLSAQPENPYLIQEFQEIKTTWHPAGL